MIRGIKCEDLAPFKKFDIIFLPNGETNGSLAETHLFTGVNGTGKTRFLSLLAGLLGNRSHIDNRMAEFPSGIIKIDDGVSSFANTEQYNEPVTDEIVEVFSNFSLNYNVPRIAYGSGAYITSSPVKTFGELEEYNEEDSLSFSKTEKDSKELLQAIFNTKIQAAIDKANFNTLNISASIMERLEKTISEVTGDEFKFIVHTRPKTKIGVHWRKTLIEFNGLPDGLRMIVGLLAHAVVTTELFWEGKKDPTQEEAIFLFDEIETHLHPAWQRKILPAFQKLFPKAQIFVATHSPFVISSLNEGWIYKLEPDEEGKVTISDPIPASKGDSYITAVEDILGVNEWYDPETEELLQQFRDHRDAGIKGDDRERAKAISLAEEISSRSHELAVMMGAEIKQLIKILAS